METGKVVQGEEDFKYKIGDIVYLGGIKCIVTGKIVGIDQAPWYYVVDLGESSCMVDRETSFPENTLFRNREEQIKAEIEENKRAIVERERIIKKWERELNELEKQNGN